MTTCKDHPTYKGLDKPRVLCEACWHIWFGISSTCRAAGCQQAELEALNVCKCDLQGEHQ